MKKILTILAFFFFFFGFSQTGINYQAIIKNSSGNVYSNSTMVVTFSLRYDTSGGSVIYSETHNATSTSEGQISLVVGSGNKTSNGVNFSAIDFSRSIFYTTEVNIGGAGNVSLGTQQLRSVSSAYFAKNAAGISFDNNNNLVIGTAMTNSVSETLGVAIGLNALQANTSGVSNTAVGAYAGISVTTGSRNTFIGYYSNTSAGGIVNSTALGNSASISASNTIQLGNSAITDVLTSGVVSATGFQTTGTVTATSFVGDGSLLSNLPSSSANNRIWISHREFGDNTQDISRYMGSFNGYSYEFLNLEKGSSGISQTRAYFLPPSHWGDGSYKITMYFLTPNANTGNIQVSGGVITTTLSGTASTTGSKTQIISTGSDFSGNSHGGFQYGGAAGFPGPLSAAATVGTNSSFSRPLQKVTYTYNYNFSNIDFAVFYLSRYLNTGYSYSDTYNGDFYVVGIKIEKNY